MRKHLKRGIALLLALTMALSLFSSNAWATDNSAAQEEEVPQLMSSVASGTCGTNVTWILDDTNTLTISGTGSMSGYQEGYGDTPWYSYHKTIKKIVIQNGVTNIGNKAFCDLSSVTSVTIPNSVTSIGEYAFSDCSSLASVTIPSTVTNIGKGAFNFCSGLKEIEIPNGVTSIQEFMFSNCTSLTKIIIPNTVTTIGQSAFECCESLPNISLPNNLTSIGHDAFLYCCNLKTVIIPDGVTTISNFTFNGCNSLTSITLSKKLNTIGDWAFTNCPNLAEIIVPNSVTSIGLNAFQDNTKLSAIHFCGDAPTCSSNAFSSVTATAYYPEGNTTWTSDKLKNYGGTLTWKTWNPSGDPGNQYHMVCFDDNGIGDTSTLVDRQVKNGDTYGTLPTPTSDCYEFIGWFTEKDGGTQITENTVVNLTTDQTLYAHWKEITNTNIIVTFVLNGGTYKPSGSQITYLTTYDRTYTANKAYSELPVPSRSSGWRFDGWYTKKTDGTQITDIDIVSSQNHTLYAQWTPTYTLTFDPNGGTVSPKSETYTRRTYGELPIPTYNGSYIFDGWYTEKTGGIKITSDTVVTSNSHQILYAHWKLNHIDYWSILNKDLSNVTFDLAPRYFISKDDKEKLYMNIEEVEKNTIEELLNHEVYAGSCYGLSAWVLLCKSGIRHPIEIGEYGKLSAYTVNTDPPTAKRIFSAINFYQFQQWLRIFQNEDYSFRKLSQSQQINYIEKEIRRGKPTMICFAWIEPSKINQINNTVQALSEEHSLYDPRDNLFPAHAVVGLSIEEAHDPSDYTDLVNVYLKEYQTSNNLESYSTDIEFTKRIQIYDCNSTDIHTRNYLYYNDNGEWCIPSYGAISSNRENTVSKINNAFLGLCSSDSTIINNVDYSSGKRSKDIRTSTELTTSCMMSNVMRYNLSWENGSAKVLGPLVYDSKGNNKIFVSVNPSIMKDGSNYYSGSVAYMPNSDHYNISTNSEPVDFMFNSGDCLTVAESSSPGSVNLKSSGGGAMTTKDNSEARISLTSNKGLKNLPWSTLEVTGDSVKDLSIDQTNEGVVVSGDLDAVTITGSKDEKSEELDVATEEDSILLKEENEKLEAYLDTDNDGAYDVVLPEKNVASGSCGNNLIWKLNHNGRITISGSGDMVDLDVGEDAPWSQYLSKIKKVTIQPGVTSIGSCAFDGCINLTSVNIPNSVTRIGSTTGPGCAFSGCKSLKKIDLPESIRVIGSDTFHGCTALKDVTIPNSVSEIGAQAFIGCSSLASISLPSSVTRIGWSAFNRCTALRRITIPDSVTCIGSSAFYNCTGLESVTISENVTKIENGAFEGCSALNSITIPGSWNDFSSSEDIFSGCTNLTNVKILNGLRKIPIGMFRNCTSLKSVSIPESVNSIDREAFSGCTSLATITVPNAVESIGPSAFENCNSMTSIYFTGDAPRFNNNSFSGTNLIAYYPDISPLTNLNWLDAIQQNYGGTVTWKFWRSDLTKGSLALSQTTFIYDGIEKNPKIEVKDGSGNLLKEDFEYNLVVPKGRTNAGTYTYIVTGIGNYTGSINQTMAIQAAKAELTFSKEKITKTYGDAPFTNELAVNSDGAITYATSDSSVVDVDNKGKITIVGAGTAEITAKSAASNNYKAGSDKYDVIIQPKSLENAEMNLSKNSYVYDGTRQAPSITVSLNGEVLTADKDYYLSFENCIEVGTATAVAEGMGNYRGTIKRTYQITKPAAPVKKQQMIAAKAFTKMLGDKAFKLGAKSNGDGTLTYKSSNTKVVTVSKSGVVTLKGKGTATITITATATQNYLKAVKKVKITVKPLTGTAISSAKNTKGKKIIVKWKKTAGVTGYQVQYSTNKKFKKAVKVLKRKKAKTISTVISRLKKKKTYYLRVRTYRTTGGKTFYSAWSKVKRITVKK